MQDKVTTFFMDFFMPGTKIHRVVSKISLAITIALVTGVITQIIYFLTI
ncbi:MAG: hypothetical protein JXR50_06335 [Prolixibacteraceae bacterium]|nr:hypothetical protein [Prolixibacteraceae bacterium]